MFKKIASNTISQIFSKFITAFISIFLISVLTKYLSAEMYGQYNKIYNYLSFFTFFADLGLYTISIREISKDKSQASKIIGNVMTLRLFLGIFIIFLAIGLAFFLPGYNTSLSIISILIVSIFSIFNLLNSSVLSLMQAYMRIEFSLFSVVLGKIINFGGILLIIFYLFPKTQTTNFDISFILILITGLVGVIINFLLNFWYANKISKIRFLFDFEYIKHLFLVSLPYGIALFLSVVYFKVDVILLSLIESGTKGDVSIALYSVPMKIVEVLMIIGGFFLNSILPQLSSYFKDNQKEDIIHLLKNSFKFLFSFSIIILVFGSIFGYHTISLISTPDYLDHKIHQYTSLDVFIIVLFVLLFYFISAIFNYVFIASKNETTLLKINIFITIFNIIGNIILIPKYSFIGSGIVTLMSQILLFGLGFYFSRKIVYFQFDILYILKVSFSGLLIYFIGDYFVKNHSVGLILDFLVFGFPLFIIFFVYLLFLNRKELKFKKIGF